VKRYKAKDEMTAAWHGTAMAEGKATASQQSAWIGGRAAGTCLHQAVVQHGSRLLGMLRNFCP